MTCTGGAIDSVHLGEPRFRICAYSTPDVPFGFLPLRFEPFEMIVVNPAGGFWRAHSASYRIARTSVMSHIKRRIEALELDTGVVRGELPVDLGLDSVSGRLPGGDFGA